MSTEQDLQDGAVADWPGAGGLPGAHQLLGRCSEVVCEFTFTAVIASTEAYF